MLLGHINDTETFLILPRSVYKEYNVTHITRELLVLLCREPISGVS